MRERTIETKLAKAARDAGGIALKMSCPGFAGMPDRMVLMPGGRIAFIEAKAPGMKPRALQEARHRMLRDLGFRVFVLDCTEDTGRMIDEIRCS